MLQIINIEKFSLKNVNGDKENSMPVMTEIVKTITYECDICGNGVPKDEAITSDNSCFDAQWGHQMMTGDPLSMVFNIKPNQNYKEKDFCFCHNCVKEHVYIAMSFLKEK